MAASVTFPSRRSPPTGLPSAARIRGKVEHVVDQLEGDAEVEPVAAQRNLPLLIDIDRAGRRSRPRR